MAEPTTSDGGPAFPVKQYLDAKPGDITWGEHHGMSLRDWFAGMTLAGMNANPLWDEQEIETIAAYAYSQADAMLAERSK